MTCVSAGRRGEVFVECRRPRSALVFYEARFGSAPSSLEICTRTYRASAFAPDPATGAKERARGPGDPGPLAGGGHRRNSGSSMPIRRSSARTSRRVSVTSSGVERRVLARHVLPQGQSGQSMTPMRAGTFRTRASTWSSWECPHAQRRGSELGVVMVTTVPAARLGARRFTDKFYSRPPNVGCQPDAPLVT